MICAAFETAGLAGSRSGVQVAGLYYEALRATSPLLLGLARFHALMMEAPSDAMPMEDMLISHVEQLVEYVALELFALQRS